MCLFLCVFHQCFSLCVVCICMCVMYVSVHILRYLLTSLDIHGTPDKLVSSDGAGQFTVKTSWRSWGLCRGM